MSKSISDSLKPTNTNKKVKNIYDNTYYEIYALLVLFKSGYIECPFCIDWIKDKPDIQVGNIGIEVTTDAPSEYRKLTSIWNKLSGLDPKSKKEELTKLDKHGLQKDNIFPNEGYASLPTLNITCLMAKIKDKERKFSSYDGFPVVGLFVFSFVFMLDEDESSIVKMLQDNKFSFSPIFIFSNGILFKWENSVLTKNDYTKFLAEFKTQAQQIRKKYFDNRGKRIKQNAHSEFGLKEV